MALPKEFKTLPTERNDMLNKKSLFKDFIDFEGMSRWSKPFPQIREHQRHNCNLYKANCDI